nr:unnamed protein product [Callosobruchus analis]
MAILSSWLADRLRRSRRLSTTATRKIFTAVALLVPGALMAVQAIKGADAPLSVTVFTASLFFNGAVTAGYLSNGLDIAPNFSGTIFGIANTLSSFGGWLSTKIVAVLTEGDKTFDNVAVRIWILCATYAFGAVFYCIFGTGKLQKFNSIQAHRKTGRKCSRSSQTRSRKKKRKLSRDQTD